MTKIGLMGVCSNYNKHKNNQVYKISLTKMRTHVGLIPNLNYEMRKKEQEPNMCKTRIQQDFITKMKQKKQGCDKRKYPKLMFKILKIIKILPLFIHFGDLTQRNLNGSFMHMCSPCDP
jgi:hypothetical protein